MAGRKENLKALFTNTRSRVVIVFTALLLIAAVIIGFVKFFRSNETEKLSSNLPNTPNIRSIPGAVDPTAQYVKLQESQNKKQADIAIKTGVSSIPTLVRSQELGSGVGVIGTEAGKGSVGFTTLLREDEAGAQKREWINELKNSSCSQATIKQVMEEGALLSDIKGVCSCIQLKDSGYGAAELQQVCSCKELKAAGFNARDLKEIGFSAGKLRLCGFDACELHNAGFTAQQMKDGGFSDGELKGAGFSDEEIARASGLPAGITENNVKSAGCDEASLRRLRKAGVTAAAIRRISGCSATQLKNAGFTAQELKDAGFTAADLKKAGFTPAELRQAGYSARDLLNAGFSSQDLANAGFTPAEIATAESELPPGISPNDVNKEGCSEAALRNQRLAGVSAKLIRQYAGCSAEALKAAGFTNADLENAGFTPQQIAAIGAPDNLIRAAGCDPEKLKELFKAGISASRIHELNGCSAAQLKAAGFDAKALIDAGFTPEDLAKAGFTPEEIAAGKAASDAAIREAGCDPARLKALLNAGVSARRIHELNGCSAAQLKAAGFDATALLSAGFTPEDLAKAGFTAEEIKAAQASPDEAIREAGCDPEKLKALFNAGVSASRIHELNGCSAAQLKAAGFDAKALIDAGFTPEDLANAGFTPEQIAAGKAAADAAIREAGCDPEKLKALFNAGVSASRIHELNGCNAAQLKAAGFDAKALLAAGFTPEDLAKAGFTPAQLSAAKTIPDAAIREAGCDPTKLKALFNAGVSAARIHELNGCSAADLKAAGYDVKSLLAAGFTPKELLAAGFIPEELSEKGVGPAALIAAGRVSDCSPESLKAARAAGISASTIRETLGCNAAAMKAGGYTAAELKAAGFTAAELKNAGFSLADLKAAGFNAKELRDAGYSAKELKEAGFSANELKAAGYSAAELKDAGFTAAQLKAAGYSAEDLKKAGFTAAQLKAAGFGVKELKEAGFSANELKAAGFSAAELKGAGFSPTELKNAGFTAAELRALGLSARELLQAGYLPAELKSVGVSDAELVSAGINSSQVIGIGPAGPSSFSSALTGLPGSQIRAANEANNQQLQEILKRQNQQLADQKYQQKIQQRTADMLGVANQSLQDWKNVQGQVYTLGTPDPEEKKTGTAVLVPPGKPMIMDEMMMPAAPKAIIKTGDVLFAVLDTSVNSDEPGPILATIISGRFKGAKLIGSFTLPANADKMVISFNTMSVPGANKSTPIGAFAIDANTARTALSSDTDHHYLLRYGSLFAASFLEGFGNAFQSADTRVTIGGSGGGDNITVQNGINRSILENAVIGLATLGKAWGQQAQRQFSRPVTVQVYAGTALGILFTQDLTTL